MTPEQLYAQYLALQHTQAFGIPSAQLAQSAQNTPAIPLPRVDMQVLDLIGWRAWRITPTGYLQSAVVETIWLPGSPMIGEVGDHNGKGVHAYKTRNDALAYAMSGARVALGSVLLWGEVVEHERGYRAARAKIHSIDDITWDTEPPWSDTVGKALAFLRKRYVVSGE
jgi:hypothetical protein